MPTLAVDPVLPTAPAASPAAAVIVTLSLSTGRDVRHRVRYRGDLQFLASSWQRLISEAERIDLWDESGSHQQVLCATIVRLGIEAAVGPHRQGAQEPVSSWFYASRMDASASDSRR
ncbi:MAG: hypothetical protein H0V44_16750 [Planctomycetes bacterium]|nr:hypothetical protein [Planctomycetota bacterium]